MKKQSKPTADEQKANEIAIRLGELTNLGQVLPCAICGAAPVWENQIVETFERYGLATIRCQNARQPAFRQTFPVKWATSQPEDVAKLKVKSFVELGDRWNILQSSYLK